jgi:hypothetical protein
MAEWSREAPWRQGHVLTDETVDRFALRDALAPEATVAVVISHDCDLAASSDKEPEVELIVGRLIEKADGNFTHAKTPRVLHVEFATAEGGKFLELAATRKVRISKGDFADHEPRPEFKLGPAQQSILQRWLGARYRRAAFPDAFEKRLDKSGADRRLSRILKPEGEPTDSPHCGAYHLAEVRIKNSAATIIAAQKTFRSQTFSTATPVCNS